MNIERFKQIIDSYGSNESVWPIEERDAAREFLASSPDAQAMLRKAGRLDELLDGYQPQLDHQRRSSLVDSIVAKVQPGSLGKLVEWLTPDSDAIVASIWRPVLAMSTPLVLGIAIGITFETDDYFTADEERYLMAISIDTAEGDSFYE